MCNWTGFRGTRGVYWLVLAPFLLLAFATALNASSETAAAHSDRGLQLAQSGDLAGAESEMQAAVALAPQNPEFLKNLATVLAMERKLEDSSRVFERALKLAPTNLTARRYLAANLWQLHRYPEAKRNLEIILKQKGDDAPQDQAVLEPELGQLVARREPAARRAEPTLKPESERKYCASRSTQAARVHSGAGGLVVSPSPNRQGSANVRSVESPSCWPASSCVRSTRRR